MDIKAIYEIANDKRNTESDPFKIADDLGILVRFENMGSDKTSLKGFCTNHFNVNIIVINSELPDYFQKIIAAHEIGHIFMGHLKNDSILFDDGNFKTLSRTETEANMFAAEYLISDDELTDHLENGYTSQHIAGLFGVPEQLLYYKFKIFANMHPEYRLPPIEIRSDFFYDMEVPKDDFYNNR